MVDRVLLEIVLTIAACAAVGAFVGIAAWNVCAAVWRRMR